MNKTDLVEVVALKADMSKKDSEKAVKAVIEAISEALAAGDKVQIVGFGTYAVKERAAREGRNPKTGEAMTIAASKVPTFTAGKALKDAING
jgi:integration host factor beta subunit